MSRWILTEPPSGGGQAVQELQSLAEALGAERLATLAEVLGTARAAEVAAAADPYLLEDERAARLRLQGLSLGPEGEVRCLSPSRWVPGGAEPRAIPVAVLLTPAQSRRFAAFLAKAGQRPPDGPTETLALARHFFFDQRLRIVIAQP